MNDLLNWIENEAARGLSEGDTIAALTAIKWKIKDSAVRTEPQSLRNDIMIQEAIDQLTRDWITERYLEDAFKTDCVRFVQSIEAAIYGRSQAVIEPAVTSVLLRPMSEAPKDREIFALYYNRDHYGCADKSRPDAGNFHPIQWIERPWDSNHRPRWGMRWNDEYNVTLNDFAGWVDPRDLPSALSRPERQP